MIASDQAQRRAALRKRQVQREARVVERLREDRSDAGEHEHPDRPSSESSSGS